MARRANRCNGLKKGEAAAKPLAGKTFCAGLYARLSVDKEDKKDSIETQLEIMRGYMEGHPEIISGVEYVDRGFSGTNFERPGFNRLMQDVKDGTVNCILVKDLSRFGRNYLETTNYIEVILPFLGVRFISVNDHFDTDAAANGNKDLEVTLKNLVNDMYAKDVSKRVATIRKLEMEQGKYYGGYAPYGYRLDESDPMKHFLIDEPAAAVVRDIFRMADEGMPYRKISLELQRRNISSPAWYRKTGQLCLEEGDGGHRWDIRTIGDILHREEYTGRRIRGKSRLRLYENEKKQRTKREEWIVTEKSHEAIVSRELFDRVHEKLGRKVKESPYSYRRGAGYDKKENRYAGLIFCGECGAPLEFKSAMGRKKTDTGRRYFYICTNTYELSHEGSCRVSVMEDGLDKIVTEALKMQVQLFSDKGITAGWCREEAEKRRKAAEGKAEGIRKEIARQEREEFEMYGRYAAHEIGLEEMDAFRDSSGRKMAVLEKQFSAEEEKAVAVRKECDDYIRGIEALYRSNGSVVPDREMLSALIRKISIKTNGDFLIEWNFGRDVEPVEGHYMKGAKRYEKGGFIYEVIPGGWGCTR